jgi:DNA-binding response OmpR family regulator
MDPTSPLPGTGIRVLVTDDDEDTARWAAKALQTLGYVAMASHDGYSALAMIQSFMPHVVLLDLEMPSLSGFEVARRLRAHPSGRDMHLVAFTGWDDPEHRVLASATGFEAFIAKPFELGEVHRVFGELLSRDSAR